MTLAVVGSRRFPDLELVRWTVLDWDASELVVVSGGAQGVDQAAEAAAAERGARVVSYRPRAFTRRGQKLYRVETWVDGRLTDSGEHGRPHLAFAQAAMTRNAMIVNDADKVIAFWDGFSSGTRSSIRMALKDRKPLEVIFP